MVDPRKEDRETVGRVPHAIDVNIMPYIALFGATSDERFLLERYRQHRDRYKLRAARSLKFKRPQVSIGNFPVTPEHEALRLRSAYNGRFHTPSLGKHIAGSFLSDKRTKKYGSKYCVLQACSHAGRSLVR